MYGKLYVFDIWINIADCAAWQVQDILSATKDCFTVILIKITINVSSLYKLIIVVFFILQMSILYMMDVRYKTINFSRPICRKIKKKMICLLKNGEKIRSVFSVNSLRDLGGSTIIIRMYKNKKAGFSHPRHSSMDCNEGSQNQVNKNEQKK